MLPSSQMSLTNNNHFVAVAGILGSGKSTLAEILTRETGFTQFAENFEENTFLPHYYNNPKRWALHVQLFFLKEKMKQLKQISRMLTEKSIIQDPPAIQDYMTYARAQKELGFMNSHEFSLYEEVFHSTVESMPQPTLIIQLNASPNTIMKRIKSRGRDYEQDVKKDYVELLHKLQREWVTKNNGLNVLEIETDDMDIHEPAVQKKLVDSIKKRL